MDFNKNWLDKNNMRDILNKLDEIIITFVLCIWIFALSTHGAVEYAPNLIFQICSIFVFCLAFYNTVFFKKKSGQLFAFLKIPGIFFIFAFVLYSIFQILPFNNFFKTICVYATVNEIFNLLSYIFLFASLFLSIKTFKNVQYAITIILCVGFVSGVIFILKYFGAKALIILVNPDHFSGYMSMVIPMASGFIFSNFARKEKFDQQILFLFFSLIMILALILTMSRGGFFSFIFASLVILILIIKNKYVENKIWFISVFLISVLFIIIWFGITPFLDNIWSIKQEIASRYFAGRMPIWTAGIDIIKNYFTFGTGFGTFSIIYHMYKPSVSALKYATHAHCEFMEIISDSGIIGFLLFMTGVIVFLVYLFKNYKKIKASSGSMLCIGFFGSISAIMFHSLFDFNLRIPANAILLSLILAIFTKVLIIYKSLGSRSKVLNEDAAESSAILSEGKNVKIFSQKIIVFFILCFLFVLMFLPIKKRIAYHYYLEANKDSIIIFARMNFFKKAIKFDSKNPEYHYELGKIYSTSKIQEYVDKGINEYKMAIEINPFNSEYLCSMGWTYSVLKQRDKAISYFEKAKNIDPFNPYVHRNYALCLINFLNDKDKGIMEYRRAVELNPNFLKDFIGLFARKNMTNVDIYEKILPKTPKVEMAYFLLLTEIKGVKYAIFFAENYMVTYETNAELNFRIADTSFYDKKIPWEITEKYYERTLKLEPNNSKYHYWYGKHLLYRGDKIKSQEQFNIAKKLNKYKKKNGAK